MRVLTWYIPTPISAGVGQKETYIMDGDYGPVRVWANLKESPSGAPFIIDINVNGVSIFTLRPIIQADETDIEEDGASLGNALIMRGSKITLDIDQVGSQRTGKDLTVGLELEEA